ncbi:MAG: hypothetical protein IJD40_00160 [Lachnospiraceae bacterium]|nr:hypothetical protein [Lachnospiraceae bacterium]
MSQQNWEVIYPSETQKQFQLDKILEKELPQGEVKRERIKDLLIGPGLSVVFYRAKLIFAGSFLLYLILLFLCGYFGRFVSNEEYFSILAFPMLHLIFHMLSYWAEEQDEIISLKESLYYSFQYIVSLRMFYVSIGSAVINLILMASFVPFHQMGKVGMVGLSSLFLFAVLTIYLCENTNGLKPIMTSTSVWMLVCVIGSICGDGLSRLFFEIIPLAVHVVIFLLSFGLFMYYFGKVGMKYAYTCEY